MIIDFHTHTFPDKLAERTLNNLSKVSGGVPPCYDGTEAGLRTHLEKCGVDYGVVLNITTAPKNQNSVFEFAKQMNHGNLIAFSGLNQNLPDVLEWLEKIKESGIKGIKLHPDYQDFYVNDDKMLKIYEKIAELNLITVFHSGTDIGMSPPTRCTPKALAEVLPVFGNAPVVAAHFGGYVMWHEVLEHLVGKNIYLDTSFSCGRIPTNMAKLIIEKHGAEKILLGSDMPWSDISDEINFIKILDLNEEQEKLILGENARRLLNI
ncbi:MAG: amidohydrolase [Clostridia bacterium]|nr:amidohydrolase [Clostridia bacterium]